MELMPERECTTCTQMKKVEWGCEAPPRQELSIGGIILDRCPRRPVLDDPAYFGYVFWLYRQMQNGVTQEQGGLQDQPGRLLQSFRVIDSALNECSSIKDEQQAKKNARAGIR